MLETLFVIGVLTCLGCGWNIVCVSGGTWLHEFAWVIGGGIGAAMMIAAIQLS